MFPGELLKTLTLATLDQLTIDKPVFYTDGSVMESKAAAAAVHKGTAIQLRLNDGTSILQTELVAIREAIYMATRANYNTACILSDSKATIQAIDSLHPHDNKHLIKNIHEAAQQLHTPPVIAWIPSHIGIPGNESADLAAKDALNRVHPDVYIATSKRQTNAALTQTQQQFTQHKHQFSHEHHVPETFHYPSHMNNTKRYGRSPAHTERHSQATNISKNSWSNYRPRQPVPLL